MADNKIPETTTDIADHATGRRKHPWRGFWLFIAIVLSVIALVVSGYSGYQFWHFKRQANAITHAGILMPSQAEFLQQSIAAVSNTTKAEIDKLNKQVALLQTTQQALQSQVKASAVATPGLALHLTAARTALDLVAQQALLNQPKSDMLQLLRQAKANLQTAGINSALVQQIDSIHQLVAALPTVETAQAIATLQQLGSTLDQLKFNLPVPQATTASSKPKTSNWRNAWHDSWQHLRELLIIRNDNSVGQALLTDSSRRQIALALHTLVQQAMWAAMQHPMAYPQIMASLQSQASQFTQADKAQQHWLQQLTEVKGMTVAYPPKLVEPLISQLQALSQALGNVQTARG